MPQTQPTFPLSVSANHRCLVDGAGQPYLVHGDTAWSIITALTRPEAEQYLTNRAAKGVNALIINLIEHKFNGPLTRSGEHPFTDPQDLSTPNDQYFDYADWVLRRAAELGMLVFLAPMYLGYRHPADDDGWYHEAHLGGMNKCWKYGQYLGKRYAGFNNIVFLRRPASKYNSGSIPIFIKHNKFLFKDLPLWFRSGKHYQILLNFLNSMILISLCLKP